MVPQKMEGFVHRKIASENLFAKSCDQIFGEQLAKMPSISGQDGIVRRTQERTPNVLAPMARDEVGVLRNIPRKCLQ